MSKITTNIKRVFESQVSKLTRSMNGSFKNLHSIESFKHMLFYEKRRAERFSVKSSLILLSLRNYAETIHKNGNLFLRDTEYFLKLICSDIRETDAVCLYDKLTIFILLPDTEIEGAQKVCKRIVDNLIFAQDNYFYVQEFTDNQLDIEVIAYPENGKAVKMQTSQFSEYSVQEKPEKSNQEYESLIPFKFLYSKKNGKDSDFRLRSVYDNSIALPLLNSFFWENQFISAYKLSLKRCIKRVMDIVGASLLLLALAPSLIIIALLVKITSNGPVIYRQNRIGYKGKYFKFLKFRSMQCNCDNRVHQEYVKKLIRGDTEEINKGTKNDPFFKLKDDPRITKLGNILRKSSLDELPQLINVLRGEMSLVGPRPPIPYEIENYKPWHFRRILEVKPGITGLWQVYGRNKTTFDEMVRMDIKYAEKWSLFLDIKLLLKTVKVFFIFDGK